MYSFGNCWFARDIQLIFEWKKEHVISAELYSAVLEQFLFLDDISRFIEISKLAEQEGHANHPKVQEVMFQKLLHEKNTTQIQAFISMIQSKKNGISFSTNPLDNAVSHFAWKRTDQVSHWLLTFTHSLDYLIHQGLLTAYSHWSLPKEIQQVLLTILKSLLIMV